MNQNAKIKLMFVIVNVAIPIALWYYVRPGTSWRVIVTEYLVSALLLNSAIAIGAKLRKIRDTKRAKSATT